MDTQSKVVKSKSAKGVTIRVIPGHFATNHSHVNYYIDLTNVKVQHRIAKQAAIELAGRYSSTMIETIICLEGTEMVGAFMADAFSQSGMVRMSSGIDINVLMPELNTNNQMIFRDNTQKMVQGKSILLLISTVSTGKTINRALECLQYYGGQLVGICALFSAVPEMHGYTINAVFTNEDIADYRTFSPGSCELCAEKQGIDAIANSFGYSKL